jgi:hypothetical protein
MIDFFVLRYHEDEHALPSVGVRRSLAVHSTPLTVTPCKEVLG